jgi:hypothetical protein
MHNSGEGRIGNDTAEAFALLLFANNYKAWLYEEKLTHGEALWTEYDSTGKDSIVDRLLLDQEFVLEENSELLVHDTTKQTYKKAVRARKDWLTEFKGLPVCAEMMRTWGQMARDMIEDEGGAARLSLMRSQSQQTRKKETKRREG